MRLVFIFCIAQLFSSLFALEPVVLTEDKGEYPLGLYLEILEDKEGKLTIDDVQKSEMQKDWVRSKSLVPSFGFSDSSYWLRFEIQNEFTVTQNWLLEIAFPPIDYIDFYLLEDNGKYSLTQTGDRRPFHSRQYDNKNYLFNIPLLPKKTQFVYIKTWSYDGLHESLPLLLYDKDTYIEKSSQVDTIMGLYIGILFVMMFYNLFIFITVKDKTYLFYILYLFGFIGWVLNYYGYAFQYFWQNSSEWTNQSLPQFVIFTGAMVFIFSRSFLSMKRLTPRLDKFLIFFVVVWSFLFPLSFVVKYASIWKFVSGLGIFGYIFLIVSGVLCLRKGYRPAGYYLIAWTFLLLATIVFILKMASILPFNFFTENSTAIGSALEVILLSLGLADRINNLKKEKEQAQAESLINQRQAIENLEKANKLKDEFLANTSHELRTPLNGIIGLAESLVDGVGGYQTEKSKENLSLIISSGKRLSNLINDILDFSKLKHKELQIHLQPVDIYSLTNLILKLSEPLVKNKNLKLINEIPDSLPAVYADENRLQQILYNLIGNAIKFTEEGAVTVGAALIDGGVVGDAYMRHLQQTPHDPQHIQITITDTGIGIPTDKLESIFESFEQVDASNTRQYGGTGLGLSVTKQLIELQGGTIYAESELGKGSRFIFTLQATEEKPQTSSQANETRIVSLLTDNSDNPKEYLNPMHQLGVKTGANHLLVVDDEPVNLQVISNHFTLRGYRVTTASNGKQALEILEIERPDIVLLDVMMPMMTGYEVSQKIREKYAINQLPIIFLTAKNRASDLSDGFGAKGNDYIIKPFSKDELVSRVRTHIQLKEKTEELVILNQNLEQKVIMRTEQLNEMLDQVGKLYADSEIKRKEIESLAESRKKLSLVGQMAAGIVHDIKNPMATIKYFAESLIADDLTEETRKENLHLILREMDRLTDLTYEILDFSKGHLNLNLEELNLKEFIFELDKFLEMDFEHLGVKCILDLEYVGNIFIDKDRMRRVIVNLAKNAMEAMYDGKKKYCLTIRSEKKEDKIIISLIDNGPGIPESVQEKIFQAFTTEGKTKGTGLGLFMCKWIVEAHKGTLTYQTIPGEGTTFFIEL